MKPHCARCRHKMSKDGTRRGSQRFKCQTCGARCQSIYRQRPAGEVKRHGAVTRAAPSMHPYCAACKRAMKKNYRLKDGRQSYSCAKCYAYLHDRRAPNPLAAVPVKIQEQRQSQARQLGDDLLNVVRLVVSPKTPPDLREDIEQEILLAALLGEFDLAALPLVVPIYKQRINRLADNKFAHVYLDHPVASGSRSLLRDVIGIQ